MNSLVAASILCGCHSGESSAEKRSETSQSVADAAPIEAIAAQKGRLSSSLQIPGELIAYQQVDLYAKEASFVKKLYADVGSEVSTGQLLATMDAPEMGSQLAAAQSSVKQREAVYTASKAAYDRLFETSKTPGTISPNDLEQAAARKDADMAQWQAAKAQYRQVAETENYLQIRAPFSGVITARNVNPGAYVGPSGKGSEAPLFTLQEQKNCVLLSPFPKLTAVICRKKQA